MVTYSKELKENIVARILPPNNETIVSLCKETGIAKSTLFKWKKKALANGIKNNNTIGKLSTQDKFMIVVETSTMNEIDLSEYCRKKGLYVEQVKSWKDTCMQANGGIIAEAARLSQELKKKEKEYKKLESELKRKEKALAETAALLVLRKKTVAIWGDAEDE